MSQYNTIILKKAIEELSWKRKQTYKMGDLIYGKGEKQPVELKRWTSENEEKAEWELEKYFCWIDRGSCSGKAMEYALIYCQTDENGEVIKELRIKFAKENKEWTGHVNEHYGIQIGSSSMGEYYAFDNYIKLLENEGIPFNVLPLCQFLYNDPIEMIEYESKRGKVYCVTYRNRYYCMRELPFDGDYPGLIEDVNNQINHGWEPQKMKSKFRKVLDDAYGKARYMELSENEKKLLIMYKKRVVDQNLAEEKTDWDVYDPVDVAAEELLEKRRVARILYQEGYGYDDIEYLAQFDKKEYFQINRSILKELKVAYDDFMKGPYWGE